MKKMKMKAVFSPAPSYSDPQVRKVAGWLKVLDIYKQALEELEMEVFIPKVPPELVDDRTTVSKILSYDVVASMMIKEHYDRESIPDLFLGPPGYSLNQMLSLSSHTKKMTYVFNNQDLWRDFQLAEEFKKFNRPYDLSPTWRWINRRALELSDCVLSCIPFVTNTHAKVVPKEKIKEAFWGVDSVKFHPKVQEDHPFRILFVGGDPIRKGLIYLLEALKEVNFKYELWIVGCGPGMGGHPVLDVSRQFGMVLHNDMCKIYQECDILVCPTLEDGVSLAVQESMSCGLVPIGSPDISEVFVHDISGYRVNFRDVEAIRYFIKRLHDEPNRLAKMKLEARKLARIQTWDKTKEQVKLIINEVMEMRHDEA